MKSLLYVAALPMLPVAALAIFPAGRGEIFVGATATATYDSNLTGRNTGTGDFSGSLSPTLSYDRKVALIEVHADLGISFVRYLDETQFNSENTNANFVLRLSEAASSKLTGSVNAGYVESNDVVPDLNDRVSTKTFSLGAQGNLITGPRTTVTGNLSYSDSMRAGASDQELFHAGSTFDYRGFLDDTTLRLSYDYDDTLSSGENVRGAGLNQSAHQFLAGLGRPLYRDVFWSPECRLPLPRAFRERDVHRSIRPIRPSGYRERGWSFLASSSLSQDQVVV